MSASVESGSRTSGGTGAGSDVWTGALAAWVALWLVVGAWTGYEVWQLSELGATVADSGRALDSAGSALQGLGDVPLVGDSTSELGEEVRANAADIVADADSAQSSLRQLAVLLGLSLALLPSVPAVVLIVLLRRRQSSPVVG